MAFNIWRLTDGKAGHDSQSIGLCKAIEKLKTCERFDISTNSLLNNGINFFLIQFPAGEDLPDPNIIIGAGHSTHLPMICAKRARGGNTIVLMKPSLPISFFDVCIVPKHDQPANKENIITTCGAINPVSFNENKVANTGLILIGGPSKHYFWNNESIVSQITQIITNSPGIHWTIADSPRTPETTLASINRLTNVDVLNFTNTDSKAIRDLIYKTDNIWVTKDSVSMIYESLSSGAAVGLLEVEPKNNNRIADAINNLINDQQLNSFAMWKSTNKLTPTSLKLNEADRCGMLLLERGLLG
jgi:uncharacterized protein